MRTRATPTSPSVAQIADRPDAPPAGTGTEVAVAGLVAVFLGGDGGPVTIVLDSPGVYVDYVREWLGGAG